MKSAGTSDFILYPTQFMPTAHVINITSTSLKPRFVRSASLDALGKIFYLNSIRHTRSLVRTTSGDFSWIYHCYQWPDTIFNLHPDVFPLLQIPVPRLQIANQAPHRQRP